ncbi:CWF19-like protein mug161 [Golovinomyces cichoracearum]|uniref:CWF19-like protein mug161 n=1 Tax=Golovinomyces cichoracearum TaxID=62708 RepID=A0A420IC45_9PEZI|nr:CWF19-like protein mug161 [Golovinomyces cichoracearum]
MSCKKRSTNITALKTNIVRIVVGDVNGQYQSLFDKLAVLHAKNDFSFALIVGNLFSEDQSCVNDLIAGKFSIPIPTYFTVGNIPLPPQAIDRIKENEEIIPNLHFLGKRSTTKTSEGVRIVTLGGTLNDNTFHDASNERYLPFHKSSDAKLLNGANRADILLTNLWPASIMNGSKIHLADCFSYPRGHEHISSLCANLKPRYHFSLSPDFYLEREPFYHHRKDDSLGICPVTRFISLPTYGVPKQKFLYAFTLPLNLNNLTSLPPGTTASPLNPCQNLNKRQATDPDSFSRNDGYTRKRKTNKRTIGWKGKQNIPLRPDECFFCLSNPKLESHLIAAIGEDSYLTVAKGPLTTTINNTKHGIDFPAHILIISLTHSPTIASITEEENAREKTFAEMNKFREALQNMIAKMSGNRLGAVTYDISKRNGIHTHWQFIPVPEKMSRQGLVEAAFRVEAENLSYPDFEVRDPPFNLLESNFFRAWIWTPPSKEKHIGSTKCITMSFDDDFRFSLQYGRTVLAKLLGLEERIQWRDCAQSEEEEIKDNEKFKLAFKGFDFTD